MITLHDGGVYLVNGTSLVEENSQAAAAIQAETGNSVTRDQAAENTIAYGILKAQDRKSTRLNSSHIATSRMPSSA